MINGRAAVRREVGGVERVAREMATLLPRLDPQRYRVAAPPRLLAHRAGHLWEQFVLPSLPGEIVYCPAMLGPVRRAKHNVMCIYDAASVRHPEWYTSSYARYQARVLPRLAQRARLVITASRFARTEVVEVLGADPASTHVIPLGVGERFTPDADPSPARAAFGLERPYVLTVGSLIARKNFDALAQAADTLRAKGSTWSRRAQAAATCARAERGPRARLRGPGAPARPLRGRGRVHAAVAVRGLRPARAGGDGLRRAGGGIGQGRVARGVRERRDPRGPRRHAPA